jgi:GT2 family glycosyltransferase
MIPERQSHTAGVVVDCDVANGIPSIAAPRDGTQSLIIVRVFTEPIGVLSPRLPGGLLEPHVLAAMIVQELGPQLRQRVVDSGLPWSPELATNGLYPPRTPGFLETRARVLHEGPEITVAVCTRDRPQILTLLLESLIEQQYKRLRVLVVDNAPSDGRTRQLVTDLSRRHDIEYVEEPHPGLSWARNRAIEASDSEIIAWADDDETCDPNWAAELARGFVEVPAAGAVTGIVIPSELETESQVWFEDYCGVRRGRGFTRAVFSPATRSLHSPLYPLPPFGSGNNMAFRRHALEQIGGFDCALGAGTLTGAAEDTAALSNLLMAGGTIVYQPTAIVRHHHRRDYASLRRQMQCYGRGLGAYYMSMLVHHPAYALELLRLSPRAIRDKFSGDGPSANGLDPGFPRDLVGANRLGLLQGPFLYGWTRLQVRRSAGGSR